MGFTEFVGRQCALPRGAAGKTAAFLMSRMNRRQYRAVEEGLSGVRAGRVLDIGFGSGRLTGELAAKKPGLTLYGVELSADMLASARHGNASLLGAGRMFLRLGDVAELPYRTGFFQAAYTVNTVYFWRDPERCLREVLRVLAPGGTFLSAFYYKAFLDKLPYTEHGFQKYTAEEWEGLARKAGFVQTETRELKPGVSACFAGRKER